MADDKTLSNPRDASQISLSEDYEVDYWTRELSVTKERLTQAVETVGSSAVAVKKYLGRI